MEKQTKLRYDGQTRMLVMSLVDGIPSRQKWYAIEGKKNDGPLTIDKAYVRTEEDARYIVKACNAYPALIEALTALVHALPNDERLASYTAELDMAERAIAMAKGEQ